MTCYALNAVFFLPQAMAGSKIAEVNIGRFASAMTAGKMHADALKSEPKMATGFRAVLEYELECPIIVKYIVVAEP